MSTSKCFVVGCKTGYSSERKKRKLAGERNLSLFKAPKDPAALQTWKIAIRRKDRELTIKDSVCELHFAEDQIKWHFEVVKFPDGTEQTLKREKPVLASGAVPSIFPSHRKYIAKRKPPRSRSPLHEKAEDEYFHEDLIFGKQRTPSPCSRSPLQKRAEDEVFHKDLISVKQKTPSCSRSPLHKKAENEYFHKNLIPLKQEFSFNILSNEIEKIKKPSKWWAVSSHEGFVVCVKWDVNAAPERQIVIDNNLSVQVLYYGSVTSKSGIVVESIESVSKLISTVDGYFICANVKNRNTNCDVFIQRNWGFIGRPKTWCNECRKTKITDIVEKQTTSFKNKLQHTAFIKQKKSQLREKIMMLQRKLELTRKENFLIEEKTVEEVAVTSQPEIVKISVEASMF